MIRHIVIFKLKESENKKELAKELKEKLLDLKNHIDEIMEIEVGIKSDKAAETNFDVFLSTKFNGFDELNIYRVHPVHKKILEFIDDTCSDRVAIDYEI